MNSGMHLCILLMVIWQSGMFACKDQKSLSEPLASAPQDVYFYRSQKPVYFTFKGDFKRHFPPVPGEYIPSQFDFFPASLSYSLNGARDEIWEGKARIRGEASLTVCAFPKLEFRVKERPLGHSTPFFYDDAVNIGTHCDEGEKFAEYGKLLGEKAVYREAFVYALMSALGIPGHLGRPAVIRYIESSTGKDLGTKQAFFLETSDTLAQRQGWTFLKSKDSVYPRAYFDRFDRDQLARIHIFNVLVGNHDYQILAEGILHTLNIHLFATSSDTIVPVSYDFDVATMVTGKVLSKMSTVETRSVYSDPTDASSLASVKLGLDRLRVLLRAEEIERGLVFFRNQWQVTQQLLEEFPVDQEGREKILMRSRAFQKALQDLDSVGEDPHSEKPSRAY